MNKIVVSVIKSALVLSLFFQGCSNDKPGVWKNQQIDPTLRNKFHGYNNELLKNLKTNNFRQLQALFSEELIENAFIKKQAEVMSNQLKLTDFDIYDEYYVINKGNSVDTIKNTTRGINSYELLYEGIAPEMYFVYFVAKTGNIKQMITAVYCKLDYGWKLVKLEIRPYTINGKTGPELYQLAKEKINKDYYADAVNIMETADTCARPGAFMKYSDNIIENKFYNTLIDTVNNKFKYPLVITSLPTHPKIFRVFNNHMPDGYYPIIYYTSSINLQDTAAIKKENNAVKKVIGQIMPGIDKDKKYLFYSVFNQLPNRKKPVNHFDITEEIK